MSKKNTDLTLLIPGATGWGIWSVSGGNSTLKANTEEYSALQIKSLPNTKNLRMAFPVRELNSIAVWSPSGEDVEDLINIQVEKMGLSQPEELGNLTQHTEIHTDHGSKKLYAVDILRAPAEGTLPAVTPSGFNISPRCYPFSPSAITLWQEFGQWVFALSNANGEVVYYQGLTSKNLGAGVLQDVQFVVTQLQLQEVITSPPAQIVVWTEDDQITPEGYEELEKEFKSTLSLQQKPSPIIPDSGALLPADTRAERLAAKKRKQISLISSLAALLLVGLIGFAIYNLMKVRKEATDLQAKADKISAENTNIAIFAQKRKELTALMDSDLSPMKLLFESTGIIPSENVRIIRAEFVHQPTEDGQGTYLSILINGESPDSQLALEYDEELQKHKPFQAMSLQWTNPAPSKSQNAWKFNYSAEQL